MKRFRPDGLSGLHVSGRQYAAGSCCSDNLLPMLVFYILAIRIFLGRRGARDP